MKILVTAAVIVGTVITLSFTTKENKSFNSDHKLINASMQDTVPGKRDTMRSRWDTMRNKRDTMRSDTTRMPR